MKFCHFSKLHPSFPFRFKKTRQNRFILHVKFDKSCFYDHGNNDQKDWNKLWGYKTKYFKPMYNSFMVGWRANNVTGRIEINAYGHNKGDRQMSQVLQECFPNQWYELDITVHADKVVFKTDEHVTREVKGNYRGKKYRINPWFGGNLPAPKYMKLQIRES